MKAAGTGEQGRLCFSSLQSLKGLDLKETRGVRASRTGDTTIILTQSLEKDVGGCIRTKNSPSCGQMGLSASSSQPPDPSLASWLGYKTTLPPEAVPLQATQYKHLAKDSNATHMRGISSVSFPLGHLQE